MERESFEDEEIGRILSDNFVCIKVDREERPDVDKVYMTFVQVCVHVCLDLTFLIQVSFIIIFCLRILSQDFWLLMSKGDEWRWRMAHERLVDPGP